MVSLVPARLRPPPATAPDPGPAHVRRLPQLDAPAT